VTERGPWRLFGCWEALPLLLGSLIFIHGIFHFLGLMMERSYELKVLIQREGTIGAWSNCQEPWERASIFSLVSISSLSLLFVNPRFSTMES